MEDWQFKPAADLGLTPAQRLRSLRREALEKEWDRRHPGRAGPTAERDTFVRRSMRGFSKTLRARLVGLVLVLPLVVIVTIIVYVNYN